jgi:hypothetical protein
MFWNTVTKLVGCIAVMTIVAVVMVVIVENMMARPPVDEDYLRAAAGEDLPYARWSGDPRQEKSLFERAAEHLSAREREERDKEIERLAEQKAAERLANLETLKNLPVGAMPLAANGSTAPGAGSGGESSTGGVVAAAAPNGILDIESKRPKIAPAVEAFFAAKDVEAKLPYVRNPERVQPMMAAFYKREPMHSYKWRGLGWVVSVAEPGYRLGYVQALFEDATPSSLVIEELPNGEFRVDWEGFVRYGELAWKDFLQLRPVEPTLFRVIASRPSAVPVTGATPTTSPEWLELRHPAEQGVVLGYFDKADPNLQSLQKQLTDGNWKDVPLTLRLCYPAPPSLTTQPNVRIAGVEGKGWLILSTNGKGGS